MRAILLEKYPNDPMATLNRGFKPNDAVYHAEATLILRFASRSGGDLSGRDITMVTSQRMCESCKDVLPLIARELGNPRVRIMDGSNRVLESFNGVWQK
jgi:hypothetical protein